MNVSRTKLTASAGTNYVFLAMPVGAHLRTVSAMNNTKSWQKVSLVLATDQVATEWVSLAHRIPQPGNRAVTWHGDLSITGAFIYVIAIFYGADASDQLKLWVGFEMSKPPWRWP